MDQDGLEGLRDVSRRGPVNLSCRADYCGQGGKADIAKPMHGMESGIFEIALPFQGDAFRAVYAVHLAGEIWVVHAFQKKSTKGSRTPKREIDLIQDRLNRLKEWLR